MTTIGYNDIENVLLSLTDPNTWGAISNVPWVSSPKINWATSVYNVEWGTWIAWWSTNISWSASDKNTVAWTSWSIYLPDWTTYTISSGGNTWDMTTTTYIYYDIENEAIATTTSASVSVGKDKLLLCVANPVSTNGKSAEFQAFWTNDQSTFIYASNIAANTITGNEIAANTITASEIASGAITTNKIAAWAVDTTQLADYSVVADKMYVSQLSAISANLWTITAWTITGTTITAGNTSSWAWITLYPSWSTWYLDFYYSWSRRWRIQGTYASWVWNCLWITWSYIVLDWDVYCLGKLRIPVWTDLY